MSQEVEHTQEVHVEATSHEVADAGVAASLGLNTQLFAFQLINFAIVAVIIWFLILKPLTKKLEERKNIIDESLDNAKKVDANLQMAEQKFQEKIGEARAEANNIITKSQEEGEKLTTSMKEKATKDIHGLIEQAKKKIQAEKQEVVEGIKKETAGLVVAAVEKILDEKLDDTKDKKLINDTIKNLKK